MGLDPVRNPPPTPRMLEAVPAIDKASPYVKLDELISPAGPGLPLSPELVTAPTVFPLIADR